MLDFLLDSAVDSEMSAPKYWIVLRFLVRGILWSVRVPRRLFLRRINRMVFMESKCPFSTKYCATIKKIF